MRKLILYIASSLDGFIAGEDNDIGWLFTDDEYGYAEFIETVDTILMGRKTYDLVKSRKKWPYPDKKCYVFTKESNPNPDKRVMFTAEPVEFTKKLLDSKGKNIWLVGGSKIVTVLLNKKMVHELILSIHPILLGSGIPLFAEINSKHNLILNNTKEFKSGLVQLYYDFGD